MKDQIKKGLKALWMRYRTLLFVICCFGDFFFIGNMIWQRVWWAYLAFAGWFTFTSAFAFYFYWEKQGWLMKEIWKAGKQKDWATRDAAIEAAMPIGFSHLFQRAKRKQEEKQKKAEAK